MATFLKLDGKPFAASEQDAITLLELITPAEKAQAVPLVRIWRIDPTTGKPSFPGKDGSKPKRPISSLFSQPPMFGLSVDNDGNQRFRERPPVSMERMSIKSQTPWGIISYRIFEFDFVVHRPDVVFDEQEKGVDNWSSMIEPGAVHAVQYGWTASPGVNNGILNGDGYSNSKSGILIPALQTLRLIVTNYKFKIMPDNQLAFKVTAQEDGHFNLGQATLGVKKTKEGKGTIVPLTLPIDVRSSDGKRHLDGLKSFFRNELKDGDGTKQTKTGPLVSFKKLADTIFAPIIESSLKDVGYSTVKLFIGDFNERVGKPFDKYSLDGPNIGDFMIPLSELAETFASALQLGQQLTFFNFIKKFIEIFHDPATWDRSSSKKRSTGEQVNTMPTISVRTIVNTDKSGSSTAHFYIFDAKAEYAKLSADDISKGPGPNAKRSEIKEYVTGKGIPYASFMKGMSYIENANFEVIQTEAMRGIFMRRAHSMDRNRSDVTSKTALALDSGSSSDPALLLYSGAIQGEVTMIGNFVFDIFSLIWIDFGVKQWDGPFNVQEREDVVERGSFTTKIRVFSESSDPLGTQGKNKFIGPIQQK